MVHPRQVLNTPRVDSVSAVALAASGSQTEWSADVEGAVTTTTIVRVTTSDGHVGYGATATYSMGRPDLSHLEATRTIASSLLRSSDAAPAALTRIAGQMPLPPNLGAMSALDAALWDRLGRSADLPVYQLLGGEAQPIRAYASLPFLGEIGRYLDVISELVAAGFNAVKLHTWCVPDLDLRLVDAVKQRFGDDITFMLDVEQSYTRAQAIRVGRALDEAGFEWLEAPLPDHDIEGYIQLRDKFTTPVLCSGNLLVDPRTVLHGAKNRAWDALRFDASLAGGITASRTLCEIGSATNLGIELQSWGHSLIQSANLHVGLGMGSMRNLELAVPLEQYEIGVLNPIAVQADGNVAAPDHPGLGIDLDWDLLVSSAVAHYTDTREARS